MTTQTYQQASQRFLAQAKQELAAGDLHGNFYENEMSAEDIAESLNDVQALLDRLETLLKQV